ncbi:hypothetical protein HXZ66_10435 [Bacillus sp. A116_S68]|nr:hypothetical protein HXZ66_10435 [Bacillus sp. A116_S68]
MEGVLKRSVEMASPVEMIYMSNKGLVTKRTLTIHKITNDSVTGFCHLRKQIRHFKKQNILSVMPITLKDKASHHFK